MKSLIIGGSGKIGKSLNYKHSKKTFFKNKIKNGIRFNLIDDDINLLIEKYKINRVILLSAISDPDLCLKKKKYSNKLNVHKTKKLINILIKKNIYFIFFSSEYIFDGKIGNYQEHSKTKPNNLYGKQKLIIENFIKKKTKNFSILRIGKTYGSNIKDKTLISNFLNELIKGKSFFKVANDQIFSPLFVGDLRKIVDLFLKKKIKGVFNVGGPQQLSRYEVLESVLKSLGKNFKAKIKLEKISLKDIITLDKRPLNVSMNIKKLKTKIKFKMKTISNIAFNMVKKKDVKSKIFKRR
ncbi:sugar nucleotide-binding protein [Pelagibacteraceae bacterium]|jgi:dTDP-4-dehydrorhamnose reductase|nr:sugar nucleotide-binding protein [Pelagibacteraceae bacterium]